MATASLGVDTGSGRSAWSPLVWFIPLTAAWTAINYAFPAITSGGAPTVASRLIVHVMIALGLWLGLERTGLAPAERRNAWLAVMIPFTLWLAIVWSAAINDFFRAGGPIPLVPVATLLPVIVGVPLLLRWRVMGQVLDAMPASWMVALQGFRVLGSTFLVGWAHGTVPGVFALPTGVGDVLTGLLALPVALALASGSPGSRRAAITWNIFGLVDFLVALSIGNAIGLRLIETRFPSATGGLYPVVMIPAFGVPTWIMLHALSLRQLWRRNRNATRGAAD